MPRAAFNIKEILKQKAADLTQPKKSASKINHEHQDFGIRLAYELKDEKRKSLYMKYAKVLPRALLEDAKAFALSYKDSSDSAKPLGRIFMWRLHRLIEDYKQKYPEFSPGIGFKPRRTKKR